MTKHRSKKQDTIGTSFAAESVSGVFNERSARHRGVSLMELMVSVAIIAVLISVLLPALSKLRKTSQNVNCKNNLDRLGMMTEEAMGRYDGLFPLIDPLSQYQDSISLEIAFNGLDDNKREILVCPADSGEPGQKEPLWKTSYRYYAGMRILNERSPVQDFDGVRVRVMDPPSLIGGGYMPVWGDSENRHEQGGRKERQTLTYLGDGNWTVDWSP